MARIAVGAALLLLSLVVRADPVDIVEFYNPDLDHFFITAEGGEAAILDSGVSGRWIRTGEFFEGWVSAAEAPSGAVPVYRFYAFSQNSHFYTSSASEKDYLVSLNPNADPARGWILEGIAFYAAATLPGSAKVTCSTNSRTVQRAYNNGFGRNGSNHRYFMNPAVGEAMRLKGWTVEGTVNCYTPTPSRLRFVPIPVTCGVGESCNAVIAKATGGGTGAFGAAIPYTFAFAPQNFAGLAVSANSGGVSIAGTPSSAGVFQVQVAVGDGVAGHQAAGTAVVRVEAAPKVWLQTAGYVTCYRGEACNIVRVAQASGGRGNPYAFQAAGLPAGLALEGVVTYANLVGTATQSGVFNATITAIDRLNVERNTQALVVSVSPALAINTTDGNCVVNQFCQFTVATASGGNQGFPGDLPYSYYHDPATSLPPSVMTIGQGDGVLSGTPTRAGSYAFGVCVYDRASHYKCAAAMVTVTGPAPTQTGSIKWTIGDQCNNGEQISYKYFDRANNLVWPSSTTHYVINYNQNFSNSLSCVPGAQVCIGADSVSYSWGVGISGTSGCSSCCGTCDGQTYSYNFGCPSSPPPPGGTSYYANWSCGSSSQCATVMGGSVGSKGPFCSLSSCQAWGVQNIQFGYSCSTQPTYAPDPGGSQCIF
jgi:hypothetical protein